MSITSLEKRLKTTTGRGFLSSLILLLVIAGAGYGGFWYLKKWLVAKQHKQLLSDVAILTESLRKNLDCDRTWLDNAINVDLDCLPSENPKPLLLKGSDGLGLTQPLLGNSQVIAPLAENTEGSGQMGPWFVRSYCDRQSQSIVVRIARGPMEKGEFFKDSYDGTLYNWSATPPNPVLGLPGKPVCPQKFQVAIPSAASSSPSTTSDSHLKRLWISLNEFNHSVPHSAKNCGQFSQMTSLFSAGQSQCKKHCVDENFFSGYFEECCSPPQCSPAKISCVCVK